ncbi:signal peptidase II [Microlunatus sp. Gsoil 973]|uniref:signal peptidase II n=1 Tax=Microlunatus sp. Gsoil 973 TaxID=2672569 RepID=UPI001E58F4A7|nr:signal peptidase II [Microlunatus sp. Gsoil 973]
MAVAAAGLALDLITKQLASSRLDPYNPVVLFGGLLRLQLIRNSGAAFSLGAGYTPVFAALAAAALLFVIIVLLPRLAHTGWAVALGFLMAGVAGNLVDRIFREPGVFRGHVVDFLQLPHWAIFNVADMCVCAAAALIVILAVFKNISVGGEHYARRTGDDRAAGAERSKP